MKLPFEVAVRATGARVFDLQRAPDEIAVSTDTRTLRPGDAFLALRGDRFDGHDYTAQAVERGAAALIVDRESARVAGVPTLLVDAALQAYMTLARAARERFSGRVVAITGSTGKTTTKVLLEQLLEAAALRVRAAPANENNEIGVSKLLLGACGEDAIVAEFGARRPGDIAALVEVARPDIGVLTNIGEAHLEIMGSHEVIEETKWALFGSGARAVLNLHDEASQRRAVALDRPPLWFSASDAPPISSVRGICAIVGERALVVADGDRRDEYEIDVRLPGAHNRANLAAALAASVELACFEDPQQRANLLASIPRLTMPKGRYETIVLERGPRLIYDAYNANASGMLAALDTFARERAARRIALLASMAELGTESELLHERVGERAAASADWLLAGGEYAQALVRGAVRGGLPMERIVVFASNAGAAEWLLEHATRDDLVLLKGSRKYQLEEIVEMLRGAR